MLLSITEVQNYGDEGVSVICTICISTMQKLTYKRQYREVPVCKLHCQCVFRYHMSMSCSGLYWVNFTVIATVSIRAALHSAARGDLVVPCTRRRLDNRAFCVDGPIAWNSLSSDI